MSQFELIGELLAGLRKEEIRSLRRFLQLFEEGSDTNKLKGLVLLELLLNARKYSEEKVCTKLYGDSSPGSMKTFNKMLLRFKDKIYELLILDINLYRKEGSDDLNRAVSEVRKKLLQVHVLDKKVPNHELHRLYEKIKVTARKYELYDELLQCLAGQLNMDDGHALAAHTMTEILYYERCRNSLLKARDIYIRLVQQKEEQHILRDAAMYDKGIDELEHEYRYTKSSAVGYMLNDLTCYYQKALGNYDEAEKAGHRVISIISENPAVYRNERMTKAFLSLAGIELCRYKFKQAESTLLRALVYSKDNESLALEAGEISFLSWFYRGQFEKASQVLTGHATKPENLPSLVTSKWSFFRAASSTAMGKTHDALLLLQHTVEAEKVLPGWNAGVRLMVILNLVESGKLDSVESHIENFRKFLERNSKTNTVTQRNFMIVKLLARLANESFDFRELMAKEKDNISLLESNIPGLAWKPGSPELIIFPLWLRSKATGIDYQALATDWFENNKIPTGLTLFD